MRDLGKDQHQRLKTLYGISKLLSTFKSIEATFPKILDLAAESFPLHTVVLVENRTMTPKTIIWHSKNAKDEQIASATSNARDSYSYMVGASDLEAEKLQAFTAHSSGPNFRCFDQNRSSYQTGNFIALPLMVDDLPPLGIIQFEGSSQLNEMDLDFISGLTDLICVALDRYYKTKKERRIRVEEAKESSAKISKTNRKVLDLESERELRESFVSLLTHDLRTPLSAVLMAAHLILKKAEDPEACRALSTRITSNVNRAGQMITNLLDANQIRSGDKLPLQLEPTEISALVQDTLDVLTSIHGDRFVFKPTEVIEGFWDQKSIVRILENLCNNAFKYGYDNTPILVSTIKVENEVHLIVHNEGDPISPADQLSIFKQFKRTDTAQEGKKKGWGIGLTLVQGVADAHGGRVKVESGPNLGTTFTVILPLDPRNPVP